MEIKASHCASSFYVLCLSLYPWRLFRLPAGKSYFWSRFFPACRWYTWKQRQNQERSQRKASILERILISNFRFNFHNCSSGKRVMRKVSDNWSTLQNWLGLLELGVWAGNCWVGNFWNGLRGPRGEATISFSIGSQTPSSRFTGYGLTKRD